VYVDPTTSICGVPALRVRDSLRDVAHMQLSAVYFADRLKIPPRKAERLVVVLVEQGLLQVASSLAEGDRWYELTLNGSTFALASGARPIARATAEKRISEFLQRVKRVNTDDYYLYAVEKVIAFGSYLSDADRLNDIDLAVELRPKFGDRTIQKLKENVRVRTARESGKRFHNLVERLHWPQAEVFRYLKSRSRSISLHQADDPILTRAASKQVFPGVP
jgi:predicted nucleotidyltransferase